jgi:hypothetical protein
MKEEMKDETGESIEMAKMMVGKLYIAVVQS